MQVKISEALYFKVGPAFWTSYGIAEKEKFSWQKYIELDLARCSPKALEHLIEVVTPYRDIRGTPTIIYDVGTWIKAIRSGAKMIRPRTVMQFHTLCREFLKNVPGHRIYSKDELTGVWYCYYVESLEFHREYEERGTRHPAYETLDLYYTEFEERQSTSVHFYAEACVNIPVEEALLKKGYLVETPALRATYLASQEKFFATFDKIGKQFWARGMATDDMDGNPDKSNSWWSRQTNNILLDRHGEPSRVVIDIFKEDEKEERGRRSSSFNPYFWTGIPEPVEDEIEVVEEGSHSRGELTPEELGVEAVIEVPLHPVVAIFDMKRHLRLRCHVDQLEEYIYTPSLGEKLVLPEDCKALIEILMESKGEFQDIISSKGGGALILCSGPPGTGKTLTAEVFAEVEGRPLYTVQCSQLGLNPQVLEDELLKVFTRSQRWNAILLLDEADVYVHRRGSSLTQNAIVGVFLRVLEYYRGVMFLTTNRAELVDDAIASRCVARITYTAPGIENQKKIWKILAETANIKIEDSIIDQITTTWPSLSGRDVKQLLKLSVMIARAKKKAITFETVQFVKRFKPTEEDQPEQS